MFSELKSLLHELVNDELFISPKSVQLACEELDKAEDKFREMTDELTRLRSQEKQTTKREVISCDSDPMESFSIDPESYF